MSRPKLVALDVDGTITGADHAVSQRTVASLRRLSDLGIAGVIVSGRTERAVLRLAGQVGFEAPQVSTNGALVTDATTGQRLWSKAMDPDDVRTAVAAARRAGVSPNVWTADAWYADEDSASNRLLVTLVGEAPVRQALDEVIAQQAIVKVMLGGTPAQLDASGLAGVIPGLERSMPQFFEAAPVGATKQEAVGFLLERLGIDASQVWGFGDGGNDIGWLGLVGRVFVPDNAQAAVKVLADQVIGRADNDGVAEFLDEALIA